MKLKVKETNYIRNLVKKKKEFQKAPEYFPFPTDDQDEFHKHLMNLFFYNGHSDLELCVYKLRKMNQDYETNP